MTTFFSYLKKHKIPPYKHLKAHLSLPLTWHGVILYTLITLTIILFYIFIIDTNDHYLVTIPEKGGELTEGIIGAPRFINPILANTETDIALSNLVYSGLVSQKSDGTIVKVLAENYVVSPDGRIITFELKDNLKWSDKETLDSDDIIFTLSKLSNPVINKSSSQFWQNISISTPDAKTVIITANQVDPNILQKLSIGIIPKHIWEGVADDVFDLAPENLHPIGSGPFKFTRVYTNEGVPTKISFKRNKFYALEKTYLTRFNVRFFANQDELLNAINAGTIDVTTSATPETAVQINNSNYRTEKIENSSFVALYQLRSNPIISNESFIKIINNSIDKSRIIDTVENGYGVLQATETSESSELPTLESLGYTLNEGILYRNNTPLTFSIAVKNTTNNLSAAKELAYELEKIGITVIIKAFDPGTLKDGIRESQYQAILENSDEVPNNYTPIIHLYTKTYPLILNSKAKIPLGNQLESLQARYENIETWHTKTDKVWKFLSKKYNLNK